MPKVSALNVLTGANLEGEDLIHIVEKDDTSLAATGRNKQMTINEFIVGINLLNSGLALLAGRAGSQTLSGGTAATEFLALRPTAHATPTGGGVDFYGKGSGGTVVPVGRVRAVDGRIVFGEDYGWTGGAAGQVSVRRGTVSADSITASGAALIVAGGDDDVPIGANGHGFLVNWNINRAGHTSLENSGAIAVTRSYVTDYNGNVNGFASRIWQLRNNTNANFIVFGANITANIGEGGSGSNADPNVTHHSTLSVLELDSNDRAANIATNEGYCLRLTGNGINNVRNQLWLMPSLANSARFHNAICCSVIAKSGVNAPAWSGATAYEIGDFVTQGGLKYLAVFNSTNSAPPSANWTLVGTTAPVDNFIWFGPTTLGGTPTAQTPLFQVDATRGSTSLNGNITLSATDGLGYIQLTEQAPGPGNGPANTARLFVKDNGAGKSQLCVRWPSGATPSVILTEP